MATGKHLLEDIAGALAPFGLMVRGGFDFRADDAAPAGPGGRMARSVLLVGHAGGSIWAPFSAWRAQRSGEAGNPLDAWSRQVIGGVAGLAGAHAVFPSDPPYLPFQQWAMRAEGLRPSPLGILMHPAYGLWHAYRGAILFNEALALPPARPVAHPCDSCHGKPCLGACPVEAYSPAGFDVQACRGHASSLAGDACRGGCLARMACPVGASYRYCEEQQRFHQRAFLGA